MAVELNHTIVHVGDSARAAAELAELLGLPAPAPFGPFQVLELANGVSLDFMDDDGRIAPQHYAFHLRGGVRCHLRAHPRAGLAFWADPTRKRPGEINHGDGGRGVLLRGPDGHFLEIITRPYGSGA